MKTLRFIICMSVVALLSSCGYRELCYDHDHWIDLDVEFDWSLAPEADPPTMVVYFFPADEETRGGARPYEIVVKEQTRIRIPAGEYNAICYNGATETIISGGDSFGEFFLSTEEQSLLAPMMNRSEGAPPPESAKDQPVKGAPEGVWSHHLTGISLSPGKKGQKVRFTPRKATHRVVIKVEAERDIDATLQYSAALTGVSESWSPSAMSAIGRDVIMPIPLTRSGPKSLEGEIEIFGHCHSSSLQHVLTIYTSNKYYYTFDVSRKMHDSSTLEEIVIVLNDVNLPAAGGSELSPSISGWEDTGEIHVGMD